MKNLFNGETCKFGHEKLNQTSNPQQRIIIFGQERVCASLHKLGNLYMEQVQQPDPMLGETYVSAGI